MHGPCCFFIEFSFSLISLKIVLFILWFAYYFKTFPKFNGIFMNIFFSKQSYMQCFTISNRSSISKGDVQFSAWKFSVYVTCVCLFMKDFKLQNGLLIYLPFILVDQKWFEIFDKRVWRLRSQVPWLWEFGCVSLEWHHWSWLWQGQLWTVYL
jgi:hypothetical protein